jgi:hydrogenase maturation factor HypF (carbamoyltransferase family)
VSRLFDPGPALELPKVPRKPAPVTRRRIPFKRWNQQTTSLCACETCENVWEDFDAAMTLDCGGVVACPACGSCKTDVRYELL